MDSKVSAKFEPTGKSEYESHSSRLGFDEGGIYLVAPTYAATVRVTLFSGVCTAGMNLATSVARALAAELLIACDASGSALRLAWPPGA